jgi:16S rRNA (cytosine967-C5)-methyltransferase
MRNDMENTREIVLDILITLERDGGFEGKLIKAVLDKYNYLPQRDKAFIKRLAEGTIERQTELDYYIDSFSNTPVTKMKPLIRSLMRMSAYQIIYMDAVPDSAACNEACKLAQKRKFASLKGFVNAVLRNISRNKEALPLPDSEKDTASYLSVKYSMPLWIVEMWLSEYGGMVTENILKALLEIHPVSLRFDTRLSEEESKKLVNDIRQYLTDTGNTGTVKRNKYLDYIYTVENVDNISSLPGFAEGKFTVQDVSSALSVEAADIREDDTVMDICAAPGGKSILASEKAKQVLSYDLSYEKTELINENLDRLKRTNVTVQVYDASATDESRIEKADVLIMDVPCSGLGILGKKRDIKYHVSKESIKSLNELQKKIVESSWQYVKKGGTLIYSTCTIDRRENEDMVQWMLDSFPLEPVDVNGRIPAKLREDIDNARAATPALLNLTHEGEKRLETEKCCVKLLPGYTESDGFFFAVLKRKQ